MSARRVRHDPTGLVDVLDRLDGRVHAPARTEVFPATSAGDLLLVRCRCGRLFDAAALEEHLENPDAPPSSDRAMSRALAGAAPRH